MSQFSTTGSSIKQDKGWNGEAWRPFVKQNRGHLIPGSRPIPPQFLIPRGKYTITGIVAPTLSSDQAGYTLLTAYFRNVNGFHFSLRRKPTIVKVAEWFGSDVGIELENKLVNGKILLQSNDSKLASAIFSGDQMADELYKYHKALTYIDRQSRIELSSSDTADSIAQLRSYYNWTLIDRLQRAVDLMGLILERMDRMGTARPI